MLGMRLAVFSNSFILAVPLAEEAIRHDSPPLTLSTVVLGIILVWCVGTANAQTNSVKYALVVASGFLCDPALPSSCPAVTKSATGESYEISGAGSFDVQNKSMKAAGTFTNKAPDGNVLGTGVWIASDLISFDSYGVAPRALLNKRALGIPQFGSKRSPTIIASVPSGGLAVFRILLIPLSGATKTAVLQANCALGDVPHGRSTEGIRLTMEKNGTEFSEEPGGRVMFLLMRPEVAPTPPQEPTTEDTPKNSAY
jgi:hypothetical protein